MKRLAMALLVLAALGGGAGAQTQSIGIVLMHGKQGSSNQNIDGLAGSLTGAGYLVDAPEMCWSGRRIYDRPLPDCLAEIDAAVARLTGRGARRIVVAGMSLGGMAALAYGARHPNLAGVIGLAPAGNAAGLSRRPDVAKSVSEAQAMITAGRGNETAGFADTNNGTDFTVRATAAAYVSFFAPDGLANIGNSVAQLRVPLLWVAGNADSTQTGSQQLFARAPANPLNRYVAITGGHMGTPSLGREAVLTWLKELR